MNCSLQGRAEPSSAQENSGKAFSLGYRAGLDGLRGISILGVVVVHTRMVNNRAGFIGVDVFFVLSGFLITCLLVQEWDRFHSINLKAFYVRRILRLLPALVAMLTVFTVYSWITSPPATARQVSIDAAIALFYSANWATAIGYHVPNLFEHAWSLSIEEQFYLIWPVVLIWLLRRTSGRRSMLNWVLLAALLPEFVRLFLLQTSACYSRIYFGTDCRADALLLGCVAGVALSSGLLPKASWVKGFLKGSAWVGALGLLWLTFSSWQSFEVEVCLIYLLIPALAMLVLVEVVVSQTGVLNRFFSQPWLVFIGKVSYGLYVWHHPIFLEIQSRHWQPAVELAVELSAAAAATLASYYLLELPLLRLKSRFASTGRHVRRFQEQRTPREISVPS